jgi:hypothetical protein
MAKVVTNRGEFVFVYRFTTEYGHPYIEGELDRPIPEEAWQLLKSRSAE